METKVTKIVYNVCFGGFGLSHKAIRRYAELAGYTTTETVYTGMQDKTFLDLIDKNGESISDDEIDRADPFLVQVVEELGKEANGGYADIRIREIPAGTKYRIEEYDGRESVITIDEYDWRVS
jgi:hypothetical protein